MKTQNTKTRIQNLKSQLGALAKLACGNRLIRLHPKFRWLSYACLILRKRAVSQRLRVSASCAVSPPEGPPRLRLRKRRRVSVHTPKA